MKIKSIKPVVFAGTLIVGLIGCAEKTPTSNGTGGQVNTSPTTTETARIGGQVYYTGYDGGTNEYAIFVRTSRFLTVLDPLVARAEQVNITIPETTVQTQVDTIQQQYDSVGEKWSSRSKRRWTERFRNPTIWKIVPVAPGIASIKADRETRTESIWEKAEIRTIVVNSYTPQQVEMGRIRYNQGGSDQACTNCHNQAFSTGTSNGAPPHLLGRVADIDDAHAAQWIETGTTFDRTALVNVYGTPHRWNFASDAERDATVAYLRSIQTATAEDFARLVYEEELFETQVELGIKDGNIDR